MDYSMLVHERFWCWARLVTAAVLLVAAMLAPPSVRPAYAQTITVTTTTEAPGASGDCTLGEAIQAANSGLAVDACPAGSGFDAIVLAPGATYTLTTATANHHSAFIVQRTLTIAGNGAKLAHDPLGGALRFFTMTASSSLTLINLTLSGGRAKGQDGQDGPSTGVSGTNGEDTFGGAIVSLGADVVLDGVTFLDNRAQGGQGGSGFMSSSTSYGATGGNASGGAIYSLGTLIVRGAGATFSHNQAVGGKGGKGGILTTTAGQGGSAYGGAVWSSHLDASGAAVSADDNQAQGGNGGNGASNGSGGNAYGGGLLVDHEALLADATLTHNRAQGGDAGVTISPHANMSGGSAHGGAASFNTVALSHGSLFSNTAQGGAGPTGGSATGGGLAIGNPTLLGGLQNAQILSNTVAGGPGSDTSWKAGDASGGGVYVGAGTLRVTESALVGNLALAGSDPGSSSVAVGVGGGLYSGMATVVMTNTTIALNRADKGGGLDIYNADMTLTHVTIVSNTANSSGGGLEVSGLVTVVFLRNSLVAYNASGNCNATSIAVAGGNLQYPGNTCGVATLSDPLLSPVADNGGQTLTAALRPGSPAVDAGSALYCPPTDQRGRPRPAGAGCDLGAYERWLDLFLPLLRR
jgi:CSLREA domain-containing protein